MANVQASRAAKLLKISAMATRAFSSVRPPIPEIIDQTITGEPFKHPGVKKPLSTNEEKVNQEMKNLCKSFTNEMFDALKADPGSSQEGKICIRRPFTIQLGDGRVISGENVYLVDEEDVNRMDKRKLLRTEAFEVDENGNKIKPYDGEVMMFDQNGYV